MNGNFLLIYDKRVEFSHKYKKILEHAKSAEVALTNNKDNFFQLLLEKEPDMVLISESVTENLSELANEIRNLNLSFRPVLIFLSKSSYLEDKTNALNSGADDFLSEPMENEEFLARINAHLRRTIEENSNALTKLPNNFYTKKIIRRGIKSNSHFGVLFIGIDNFNAYREIYGEIAANKLVQGYSAILKKSCEYDDFIGQVSDDKFLIITSSYKCEKLADYLNCMFDTVAKKFYSKNDAENGYILLNGSNKSGCKIPLMSTSIGVVNSELMHYNDEIELINALSKVQKLAKTLSGSSKIIDRPLLTTENTDKFINEKKIVVIEKDEDLSYLLETSLKLQGFNPIIFNEYNILAAKVFEISPAVVIFDNDDENSALQLSKQIKNNTYKNIKIIVTDIKRDKEAAFNSGADIYLPKPYDIMELFQWIYKILD